MYKISILFFVVLFSSFQEKKITWTAIGDSITYLNDHTGETGNRITKGYMTLVVEKIPTIRYINQGHNGWTAAGIAEKIQDLGLVKSDVYSIFLGTNDWWSGRKIGSMEDYTNNTGIQTLFGSFRIIIDRIRSLNPDAKIILITPMQRNDFVYLFDFKNNAHGSYKEKNGQTLEQFANAIAAIGKRENLKVVDLYHHPGLALSKLVKFKRLRTPGTSQYKNYRYPASTNIPFDPSSDEYPYPPAAINMTYDGLHPSDKGYKKIASLLVESFKEYR